MDARAKVVEIARGYVGSNDRAGFWLKALGVDPGKKKHWCGAFWLACVKEAGLTNIKWGIDGTGVQALKMPQTRRPEPGDLGYVDQPYQHHFLVEEVGAETYTSIDGNAGTPGVQRKIRAFKTPGVLFYSLAPLLSAAHDTLPQMPAITHPTLRIASVGPDVAMLQAMLNRYQSAGLVEDGQFGPRTARAVAIFQRDHDLDADSIVGPKTWAKLLETP
ncbi:MAG TPA: peptidoglycan-binding domain-containing protein [Polyangiaceae bacterium]|nr:peptidoglycan-binding domain-containing protein [Polyangiaceae bacterium]